MIIKSNISSEADKCWNLRLNGNKFATIHHTQEYIEYVKQARKQPSYYITFETKDEVVGQVALHRLSRAEKKIKSTFKKIPASNSISKLFSGIKPMFVWDFGPVIFNDDFRDEIYSEIAKFSKKFKGPIKGSLHPLDYPAEELSKYGWNEKKMGTFLIDLTLSQEQLWKNVDRQSGRKAVKRALNNGIKIKPIENVNDLKTHHVLLNEGKEMADLGNYPFRSLELSWKMLRKVGQFGFIAWKDNIPLASTLVTTFNGYLNEWGFAESKKDREELLGATDLIKWNLIEWGHKSGFRYFDLSGVEPEPSNTKEKGIFRFKKKWGGKLVNWYHYTFV